MIEPIGRPIQVSHIHDKQLKNNSSNFPCGGSSHLRVSAGAHRARPGAPPTDQSDRLGALANKKFTTRFPVNLARKFISALESWQMDFFSNDLIW